MTGHAGVVVQALIKPGFDAVLTPEALQFLVKLHRAFEPRRRELMALRAERAAQIDRGQRPLVIRRATRICSAPRDTNASDRERR